MEPEVRRFLENERDRLNRLLAKAESGKAWVGEGVHPTRSDIPKHIQAIKRSMDALEEALGMPDA